MSLTDVKDVPVIFSEDFLSPRVPKQPGQIHQILVLLCPSDLTPIHAHLYPTAIFVNYKYLIRPFHFEGTVGW